MIMMVVVVVACVCVQEGGHDMLDKYTLASVRGQIGSDECLSTEYTGWTILWIISDAGFIFICSFLLSAVSHQDYLHHVMTEGVHLFYLCVKLLRFMLLCFYS